MRTPKPLPKSTLPARPRKPRSAKSSLVAFSWGYEGWGNHTRELVEMVDAVEQARGFAPPLFVDVRMRRVVRAIGFRDRAFESLLGPDRYVWMKGLGNRRIVDDSLDEATIDDPAQAEDLLDLIVQRATDSQRVIFFCACGSPLKRCECHRGEVTELLVSAASRRKSPLTVQEWPGGAPVTAAVDVSADLMRRLQHSVAAGGDSMRIPVPSNVPVARAAGLPHFSILRCRSGHEEVLAASGPAIFTASGWTFPGYSVWHADKIATLRATLDDDLEEFALEPFGASPDLPARWRTVDLTTLAEALVPAGRAEEVPERKVVVAEYTDDTDEDAAAIALVDAELDEMTDEEFDRWTDLQEEYLAAHKGEGLPADWATRKVALYAAKYPTVSSAAREEPKRARKVRG